MADAIKAILHTEANRLMQEDVLGAQHSLALNIHQQYRPSMTVMDAINEHVSNWMDQVVAQTHLLNQRGIEGNLLITREASKNGGEPTIVAKFGPSYFRLGSIVRDKERGIHFQNRESVIPTSALRLGATNKTDNAFSIGKHGEGFKTAVNCLVREGYRVNYLTHGEHWQFVHNNQILYVTRAPPIDKHDLFETHVAIMHDQLNILKSWDDDRFLCLADWYIKPGERAQHMFTLCGEDLKIEVLLDRNYHGELFSNGVLVSSEGSVFTGPYGFNFRGKSMIPGRDRKTFTRTQLINAFNNVLQRLDQAHGQRALEMLKEGTLFHDLIVFVRKYPKLWVSHVINAARNGPTYPCENEKDVELMQRWFNQAAAVVPVNIVKLLIHPAGFLSAKAECLRRFRGLALCAPPKEAALIEKMVAIIQPVKVAVKYVQTPWKLPICWDKDNATVFINLTSCTVPGEELLRMVATALLLHDPTKPSFAEQILKNKLLCDVRTKKRTTAVAVLDDAPAKRQRAILCSGTCQWHCP